MRFRWRDSRHHNRIKIMRLDAVEFLRRFLLHVLPARFVKIRHFGLLANRNCRRALTLCRRYLNSAEEQPTGLLTTQQIAAVPTVTAALCVSSPCLGSLDHHLCDGSRADQLFVKLMTKKLARTRCLTTTNNQSVCAVLFAFFVLTMGNQGTQTRLFLLLGVCQVAHSTMLATYVKSSHLTELKSAWRRAGGELQGRGGAPQKLVEKVSRAANWSPDGNLLVFTHWIDSDHPELQILDLRSNKVSVLLSSQGLQGGQWVSQDMLVAGARRFMKGIVIFDFKTQTWSDLLPGDVGNWAHSLDYKYLYYTTTGTEPKAMRIRIADYKVETIASLKDLRRARGADGNTQISVAADGSAVFTRDVGTQEIYALRVKCP